jgi:hypothetical protein
MLKLYHMQRQKCALALRCLQTSSVLYYYLGNTMSSPLALLISTVSRVADLYVPPIWPFIYLITGAQSLQGLAVLIFSNSEGW